MSPVIYKNVNGTPLMAAGGEGSWLIDDNGNRYLDACGGVAVSSLGHCHPRIVAAVEKYARELAWAHAGSFTTGPAEELAALLAEQSGGLSHVQFLSGGSEAMELAMKIAYQCHWERGERDRQIFISRRQSYHGSTLAMLALSGNPQRRSIFEPYMPDVPFVSPCYAYRDQLPGESDDQYTTRLAGELDAKIREVGPERVAGFVAETVVGSTNGAVPAVPGYFRKIKEVCERHGVLLVLDEVMAGMGRTGHHYAYLEDGIVPDIAVIGKGLAAGYQPISAVLTTTEVHGALAGGSGVLRNGQTHVNHPLACAVALEVQRVILDEDLLPQVRSRGAVLHAALQEHLGDEPFFGDLRGRGLFLGVELVADRETKAPLEGGAALVAQLKKEAFRRGLLIYPGTGTIDGHCGHHVLFAPPFTVSEGEIHEMAARFADVARTCLT